MYVCYLQVHTFQFSSHPHDYPVLHHHVRNCAPLTEICGRTQRHRRAHTGRSTTSNPPIIFVAQIELGAAESTHGRLRRSAEPCRCIGAGARDSLPLRPLADRSADYQRELRFAAREPLSASSAQALSLPSAMPQQFLHNTDLSAQPTATSSEVGNQMRSCGSATLGGGAAAARALLGANLRYHRRYRSVCLYSDRKCACTLTHARSLAHARKRARM
jgi:hypothetical protein